MEFEIKDEPQGHEPDDENTADGGLVEDHIALKNQSSVTPNQYPRKERRAQSVAMPEQAE